MRKQSQRHPGVILNQQEIMFAGCTNTWTGAREADRQTVRDIEQVKEIIKI